MAALDAKIMLIDGDAQMRMRLERLFTGAGYAFVSAQNGEEGLDLLANERPDLLMLEVVMPGLDGFEVCRRIREAGRRVPVVFLSTKSDIIDKKTGYAAGCDDYLAKPVDEDELLLRVGALIRRHKNDVAGRKIANSEGVSVIGNLEISFDGYEVLLRGKRVELTTKEFEVLALLASHPGQVFTRAQIAEHIWGEGATSDESGITVFVHKIREKIEDNPSRPRYLLTVWRVGYKFATRV